MELQPAREITARLGFRMASEAEYDVLRQALDTAIQTDLPLARHMVVLLCEHDVFTGRTAPARAIAARGLTLCPLDEAPEEHLRLVFVRALCAYQDDDQVSAMSLFSVNRSRAQLVGNLPAAARATMGVAMCIVELGDAAGALKLLDESAYLLEHATPGVVRATQRARILTLIGLEHYEEAAALLDTIELSTATPRDQTLFQVARARIAIELGDAAGCRTALDAVDPVHLGMAADAATFHYIESRYFIAIEREDDALAAIAQVTDVARVAPVRSFAAAALRLRAEILCRRGDVTGMWKALDESQHCLQSATVETVGSAIHAVVGPVLAELDHLRTVELKQTNEALTDAVSSLTSANHELADEVERHRQTQAELTETHQELVRAAHMAGMAEVATGILHDLGNALNSVGTSVDVASRQAHQLQLPLLAQLAQGLREERLDSQKCAQYLDRLGVVHDEGLQALNLELERVQHGLKHAARIISAQQRNAAGPSGLERVAVRDLVDDAVELVLSMSTNVRVQVDVSADEHIVTAPLRVVRILVNLLKNARDALATCPDAWIRIDLARSDDDQLVLAITDSGHGIPESSRDAVFRHGYTTKSKGSGFGLHASATSARELGGALSLAAQRQGEGARFELMLPRQADGRRLDVLDAIAAQA